MSPPTLADFPFDEALEGREHELRGLEKLRAIRDERQRELLFELWKNLPARDQAALQQTDLFRPQMRPASRELIDREPKKDPRFP